MPYTPSRSEEPNVITSGIAMSSSELEEIHRAISAFSRALYWGRWSMRLRMSASSIPNSGYRMMWSRTYLINVERSYPSTLPEEADLRRQAPNLR